MHARSVGGEARTATSLAGLGTLTLGIYATRGLRESGLPDGWRAAVCTGEGWVLAAEAAGTRRLALFGRPDSILSGAFDSGGRILLAGRKWVASI